MTTAHVMLGASLVVIGCSGTTNDTLKGGRSDPATVDVGCADSDAGCADGSGADDAGAVGAREEPDGRAKPGKGGKRGKKPKVDDDR